MLSSVTFNDGLSCSWKRLINNVDILPYSRRNNLLDLHRQQIVLTNDTDLQNVIWNPWLNKHRWGYFICQWGHWGRVTHRCVGNLTIIGPDNGLWPGRHQTIIGTNAGILLIGRLGTKFSEILIEIHTFSFKKMRFKLSSVKWWPLCLGLNVLTLQVLNHQLPLHYLYRIKGSLSSMGSNCKSVCHLNKIPPPFLQIITRKCIICRAIPYRINGSLVSMGVIANSCAFSMKAFLHFLQNINKLNVQLCKIISLHYLKPIKTLTKTIFRQLPTISARL